GKDFVRDRSSQPFRAQGVRHRPLMCSVGKGKQQADSNRLRSAALNPSEDARQLCARGPRERAPVWAHPLVEPKPSLARNERGWSLHEEAKKARPRLPANLEQVFETGRGDQSHAPAATLEKGVGAHRCPANEIETLHLLAGFGRGEDAAECL